MNRLNRPFFLCFFSFVATLLGCTVDFNLSDAGTDSGSAPCSPEGGSRYQNHCYLVVTEPATFFDAETACAAWGGHLVSIANHQENNYVQTIISDAVWIGLHNGSTVSTGIPVPNNNSCQTMVNTIDPTGGRYTGDTSAPYSDNFVTYDCDSNSGGNDLFIPMHLDEAGSWMFALNMSDISFVPVFALIEDTGDRSGDDSCLGTTQNFCRSSAPFSHYLYLQAGDYIVAVDGASNGQEGPFSFHVYQFVYTDAAALTYENWSDGEPDRVEENENCVQMNDVEQGKWSDMPCSTRYSYVCKRPL